MTKVRTKEASDWNNYAVKAEQFLETARDACLKKNWNAVGLTAVHAAISANDAICVYFGKSRSASDKHGDAVVLLLHILKQEKDARENSRHLAWLINRKNIIEYESRLFYQKEAEEALLHAERFLCWVNDKMKEC